MLAFIPVSLRRRRDGWSPELQFRFIEMLAAGATPGEAAGRLGKNRQNAYALRGRPGAESFAAAWDAAVAWARRSRIRAEPAGRTPQRAARRVGLSELRRAAARSSTAREALALLEALGSSNSDNSDTAAAASFSPGGPRFPVLPAKSVAFRTPGLRRGPC